MASILTSAKFQEFDADGNPLAGGKVYTYEAGTTTPKTSYTTAAATVPNANPVILDASGRADIWLDGTYQIKVYDSADNLIYTADNVSNDRGEQGDQGTIPVAVAGGTADAITANYSTDVTLTDTTLVSVRAAYDNATTTPTFAPDGLTARTITKNGGDALLAGDIQAGATIFLQYDLANTRWELANPKGTSLLDEDDFASNSATAAASQQSIAAYLAAAAVTLTNKTIATGSGNDVQTQFKIGGTTRDNTLADGTQAITGIGFTPRLVILIANISGAKPFSIGWSDGTTHNCTYQTSTAGNFAPNGTFAIVMDQTSGSQNNKATVSAFGADGFTLTWSKLGSPTGSTSFYYLCVR